MLKFKKFFNFERVVLIIYLVSTFIILKHFELI